MKTISLKNRRCAMIRVLHVFMVVLILSSLVFLPGCSKNLSDRKAEALIKDYLEKSPQKKTIIIRDYGIENNFSMPNPEDDHERPKYLELENKGLLKLGYVPCEYRGYHRLYRSIELTNKGKEYLIKWDTDRYLAGFPQEQVFTVLLGVKKFDKITGITAPADAMGQKMCEVNFETKWELTPFGSLLSDPNSNTQKETLSFVLYNDGWRIMNMGQ
jgi:hypothetical protein